MGGVCVGYSGLLFLALLISLDVLNADIRRRYSQDTLRKELRSIHQTSVSPVYWRHVMQSSNEGGVLIWVAAILPQASAEEDNRNGTDGLDRHA